MLEQIFTDSALNALKNEIDSYFKDKNKTRKHKIVYCSNRGQFGVLLRDENSDDVKGSSVLFISDMEIFHHYDAVFETKLFVSISVTDTDRYMIVDNDNVYIE